MGFVPLGNTFVTVGGYQKKVGPINSMYRYEPQSDHWSKLPYKTTKMYGNSFAFRVSRDAIANRK